LSPLRGNSSSAEQPKLFPPLVLHLAFVGIGLSRTALWVGPSLSILVSTRRFWILRFSASRPSPASARHTHRPALGCTRVLRTQVRAFEPQGPEYVALRHALRYDPRSGPRAHRLDLRRDHTPLWRHHQQSPVYPGFPPPASSAPGFSQPFDGFLLCMASLSCFIQAPPLGFKASKNRVIPRWSLVSRILEGAQ